MVISVMKLKVCSRHSPGNNDKAVKSIPSRKNVNNMFFILGIPNRSCHDGLGDGFQLSSFCLMSSSDEIFEYCLKLEDKGIKFFDINLTKTNFFVHSDYRKMCSVCLKKLRENQGSAKKAVKVKMDGYALSLFVYCLTHSTNYANTVTNCVTQYYCGQCKLPEHQDMWYTVLQVNLKDPDTHMMDLTWAKIAHTMVEEKRLMQYTLSWLSSLGGAFSALGEKQDRCAQVAGLISVEQLRIAMKLGDEIIITQCKLYFSLSLIQQDRCRLAKKIILSEYNKMKNSIVFDKKTMNICKGIWARLKYQKYLMKLAKEKSIL